MRVESNPHLERVAAEGDLDVHDAPLDLASDIGDEHQRLKSHVEADADLHRFAGFYRDRLEEELARSATNSPPNESHARSSPRAASDLYTALHDSHTSPTPRTR